MSNQSWQQTLAFAPVAGAALVSSAAATSIIPPAARAVLPANFFSIGTLLNAPAVGTTQGVGVAPLPDTAPVVGTGFDSTLTQTVDLFATWSISNAANSLTLYQYTLESLN